MAARRLDVIAAVMRKDFITQWPLILAATLLPICLAAERMVDLANIVKTLIAGIGVLASAALVFNVFHQDAVPSVRHDWLTRPIGPVNLVIAKVLLLFLVLGLPLCAAQFARELLQDHTAGEAVFSILFILSVGALAAIPIVLLALVTSSLVQAFGILFVFAVLRTAATIFLPRSSGTGGGAEWIIGAISVVVGAVFAITVVILLFRRKTALRARATYFVGIVLCTIGVALYAGGACAGGGGTAATGRRCA